LLIFGASQPNDPDPATLTDLQIQLDTFRQIYNTERIHRALPPHTIPAQAYAALPKAAPPDHTTESHYRIRHDTVDNCGKLTLRYATRLHQLGIGIAHAGTKVLIIVTTANVTVFTTPDYRLIASHTIDPNRNYWRNQKNPCRGVPPAFRTADQIRSVSERMKGIGEETPEIHARVS